MLELALPWPPSALSPNARQHWAQLAKAKKAYRSDCYLTAVAQNVKPVAADRLHLHLTFVPPSRRKFDLDNLLARMKAGLDGLADVLGVDDSRWMISMERGEPQAPGCVQVRIGWDQKTAINGLQAAQEA